MKDVTTSNAAVFTTISSLASQAEASDEWIVVITPDGSEFLSTVVAYWADMLPAGASRGSRTTVLPRGGRLTVISSKAEPFIPEDIPFTLTFQGWGDGMVVDTKQVGLWRAQATRLI